VTQEKGTIGWRTDVKREMDGDMEQISYNGNNTDSQNNIVNAERRGKRQVMIRPSSKVVVKVLAVMQKHGMSMFQITTTPLPPRRITASARDSHRVWALSLRQNKILLD
jgi:ribosomal protein S8